MTVMHWHDSRLRVRSDSAERAQRRLVQGWWRECVLDIPPGGDQRGCFARIFCRVKRSTRTAFLNFLSSEIADYVDARVQVVLAEDGALDEDRLWRNLLSSMPMCSKIFGILNTHREAAARVLAQLTQLDMSTIDEMDVEWTLEWGSPLNGRTAFDAWVKYRDTHGRSAFLGIETKYTEPFSPRVCNGPRSWAVKAWPDNHYLPNAASVLRKTRTNQLWRNVLLVAAIRRRWGYHEGLVLVLGLAGDPHIVEAVETLSSVNAHPETLVCMASLEELISASKSEVELVDGAMRFEERYLNLTPLCVQSSTDPSPTSVSKTGQ